MPPAKKKGKKKKLSPPKELYDLLDDTIADSDTIVGNVSEGEYAFIEDGSDDSDIGKAAKKSSTKPTRPKHTSSSIATSKHTTTDNGNNTEFQSSDVTNVSHRGSNAKTTNGNETSNTTNASSTSTVAAATSMVDTERRTSSAPNITEISSMLNTTTSRAHMRPQKQRLMRVPPKVQFRRQKALSNSTNFRRRLNRGTIKFREMIERTKHKRYHAWERCTRIFTRLAMTIRCGMYRSNQRRWMHARNSSHSVHPLKHHCCRGEISNHYTVSHRG